MVVPKKKTSRMRRGNRRSHDFLVPKGWSVCPQTGEYVPPHRVSSSGWYKGKKVFETKEERKAAEAAAQKTT